MPDPLPTGWTAATLDDLVFIDRELLSAGTRPSFEFHYLDISSAAEGRLSPPMFPIRFKDAPSRARKIVRRGDVLMSSVRPNLKAFAYFDLGDGFIASTGFAVLTPKLPADGRFVLYTILSDAISRQIDAVVVGSNYPAINTRDIRRLRLPAPPEDQRKRIAEILTAVDNQIEKTEALIAKYQSIKQGLMHDLFTRGVDEHGRLRPTRDEAPQLYKESELGWIPKDWRQDRLGGVCTWRSGGTPSRSNPDFWSGSVPWASPKDMKVLDLADTEEHVSKPGAEYGSRMVDVGTVFIVIRGMILAHTFPVAVAATRMAFNQDLKALECDRDVGHRFLAFWLLDHASKLLALATASTHGTKRYDMKDLYAVAIGVPKPGEQEKIVQRLDTADQRIQTDKAHLHKLRLLKLGLMQDLLTGNVPVKPEHRDQDNGVTSNGAAKAGVKSRAEGVHA